MGGIAQSESLECDQFKGQIEILFFFFKLDSFLHSNDQYESDTGSNLQFPSIH